MNIYHISEFDKDGNLVTDGHFGLTGKRSRQGDPIWGEVVPRPSDEVDEVELPNGMGPLTPKSGALVAFFVDEAAQLGEITPDEMAQIASEAGMSLDIGLEVSGPRKVNESPAPSPSGVSAGEAAAVFGVFFLVGTLAYVVLRDNKK